MYSNPALKLPPGHPEGFNASDELIEKAAYLLWKHYLLPQNCKGENMGFCPTPKEEGQQKQWVRGTLTKFSHYYIVKALNEGHLCYGAAHTNFSNLFVIDVDDPDSGDEEVIREALLKKKWSFKCFHSGRGRHFWVFFDELPGNLLGAYGSGVDAMKAIGETFLALLADKLTDKIDLRGCGNQLIKLPLQYDPFHKWVIMPFTDDGVLIENYEIAVEYAEMIVRNDSSKLHEWLRRSQKKIENKCLESGINQVPYPGKKEQLPDVGESFQEYLNTVIVGPGESNDFIYELVRMCWREGINEEEIPQLVENLYLKGTLQGRITCKDYLCDWLSKARSQSKKYYSIVADYEPSERVLFYKSDLEWISKYAQSERDRLFLAIHLWALRMNTGNEYFLSRPKATEFGITDIQYRSSKKKYEKSGLLKVVRNGKAGSRLPGLRGIATKYQLCDIPEKCDEILEVSDPRELVQRLEDMEASEEEELVYEDSLT